jgi:hypothetical protein
VGLPPLHRAYTGRHAGDAPPSDVVNFGHLVPLAALDPGAHTYPARAVHGRHSGHRAPAANRPAGHRTPAGVPAPGEHADPLALRHSPVQAAEERPKPEP